MLEMKIKSGEFDYDVYFDERDSLDEYIISISQKYRKVVLVVDENVKKLYPNIIDYNKYAVLELCATEEQKTFNNLNNVIDFYQKINLQKKDALVAMGGGIIQDIVAFTSKIYYRGIDYYLIPTTLLSMSDSSIGAKCGINYTNRKNQLGVFNSPRGVFQNTQFIKTLKNKDIISGIGEIVKLLVTSSREDFNYLKDNINKCISEEESFKELIYKSLLSKKLIIEKDEYESDLRRVLNYGHTFGHAIESLSNYEIPHGTAVLWGIDFVNFIGYKRGFTPENTYQEIKKVIHSIYDISKFKINDLEEFINYVKNDKKVEGDFINIVIPSEIGQLIIEKIRFDEELNQNIIEYYA